MKHPSVQECTLTVETKQSIPDIPAAVIAIRDKTKSIVLEYYAFCFI